MPFHPYIYGCGRALSPSDGHDRCISCLGLQHAEATLVDDSSSHCGNMVISVLRLRLTFLKCEGGVPTPMPHASVSSGPTSQKEAGVPHGLGDLRITVRGNLPGKALSIPHSSFKPQPVEIPEEHAGPSVVD